MKKAFVGGQAVLEGVLMIFQGEYAVAVQTPTGISVTKHSSRLLRSSFLKVPFLRGIFALLAMMIIGLRAMMVSSQESSEEDEALSSTTLAWTMVFSLGLALILFKFVPLFVTVFVVPISQLILFNLLDGVLRIAIFIGYIALVGRMPEIRRLYQYHGAEHKVISAYESGKLTLANARKQSRFLGRCSTTFVVFVLIVAIAIYSLFPLDFPLWQLILLRLALLIPIASISYEVVRLAALHESHPILRILLIPGFWFQRLTVREPNDQQLKVALAAVRAVLK